VGSRRCASGLCRQPAQGIFGIEIPIARLEGKWKVSQNRPEADRDGVADGLGAEGKSDLAGAVAERSR
jgi:transcriptional regulator